MASKKFKLKKNDGSSDVIVVCADTWKHIQELQERQPKNNKVKWILDEPKDKGINKKAKE